MLVRRASATAEALRRRTLHPHLSHDSPSRYRVQSFCLNTSRHQEYLFSEPRVRRKDPCTATRVTRNKALSARSARRCVSLFCFGRLNPNKVSSIINQPGSKVDAAVQKAAQVAHEVGRVSFSPEASEPQLPSFSKQEASEPKPSSSTPKTSRPYAAFLPFPNAVPHVSPQALHKASMFTHHT